MNDGVFEFSGPGFSPLGDKGRFVLPAKFRKTLKDSNSGGDKIVYLDKHAFFPCLIGFGEARKRDIVAEVRADAQTPMERELALLQANSFIDAPFDESGRFVLPRPLMDLVGITGAVYFHGAGPTFTIWDPETLLAQDNPAFATAQAHCRSLMASAKERRK